MSLKEFKKELGFSVGVSALSAWLVIQSFRYPGDSSQFPRFLSSLMLILSIALLLRTLRKRPQEPLACCNDSEATKPDEGSRFRLPVSVTVFLSIIAYILAIQYLGYLVATALFMLGSMWFFGQRRVLVSLAATVLFMALVYVMFVHFFGLRLPEGLFIQGAFSALK